MSCLMNEYAIYSFGCVLLPCLICQLVMVIRAGRLGNQCGFSHFLWTYVFMVYIWMVFQVTGLGTLDEILMHSDRGLFRGNINLIPFSDLNVSFFLNIIMCMPFGFLLPLIWKGYRKIGRTVAAGFAFSMMIELTQLVNIRATDIDDLIANTLGAFLGYLIWRAFAKLCGEYLKSESYGKWEAVWYVSMSVLGTFFLYHPSFLWE